MGSLLYHCYVLGACLWVASSVHVSLIDESTLGVTWTTSTELHNAAVQVTGASQSIPATSTEFVAATKKGPDITRFAHRATIPVHAGQNVRYKVGPPFTEEHTARIPPPVGSPVRLAALGDSGSYDFPGTGTTLTYPWLRTHLDNVDAVLHVGDLAYDRGNETVWDEFFEDIEQFAAARPFLNCVGNEDHADGFEEFRNRFFLPGQDAKANASMFWSLDVGVVHLVAFSTEAGAEPYMPGSRQHAWLEKDLADAAANRARVPWVVAFGHRPLYCSSSDYYDCGMWGPRAREVFEPLFHRYGVDLFLSGHVHSYERTAPVFNGTAVQSGTVHAMIGMGGAGLTRKLTDHPPEWSVSRQNKYGIAMIEADSGRLTLTLIESETNQTLDSFSLNRTLEAGVVV